MSVISKTAQIGGKNLTLEVGRLAQQANAAVLGRMGDTMVLTTVVASRPREDLNYFPLTVEYIERLYAGGRIKGSRWVKREGRASDEAVQTARLVDRSIRPLFPKNYKNEVQIIITVLSVDGENEPDVLSLITASAALAVSDIPWQGPVGAVRVGYVKNQQSFVINPAAGELEYSEIDLIAAATAKKIVMLEAGALQVAEEIIFSAIETAFGENRKIIELINQLTETAGKKKKETEEEKTDSRLFKKIEDDYKTHLSDLVLRRVGQENSHDSDLTLLAEEILEKYGRDPGEKKQILKTIDEVFRKIVREKISKENLRPDGRKPEEIRPVTAQVGVLPRTHGSAIFKRGQTQALSIVTLGSPSLEQLIESPTGEETKRYIHHYYMPPYSVGETGRVGWPSRREIGHGNLAERALLPVIPAEEKFPYTIRVVSEIMSSNGSTSMASVCGSTLALMDAGVPIKEPAAGLSIGLITGEKDNYVLLSDILGLEDFCGDMDFKIAGTVLGITAIQLDVKTDGLTLPVVKETLKRGKEGRMFILEKMLSTIPSPRPEISQYAPKIAIIHIDPLLIGGVIGPGGKTIRQIISQTGATVDVDDEGTVTISAKDASILNRAVKWIEGLTREIKAGEVFEGEVKRILPFGVFVEILPGKEGLVHISQMASGFVARPQDLVQIGQKVKVRVIEIDELARINLSMLFGTEKKTVRRPSFPNPPRYTPFFPSQKTVKNGRY